MSYLLGIRNPRDLRTHPLRGAVFETFVMSELLKLFLHHGERPRLFFWRDARGREVDAILDLGNHLLPIEMKAAETLAGDAFKNLHFYCDLAGQRRGVMVYGGAESYPRGGLAVRSWARLSG